MISRPHLFTLLVLLLTWNFCVPAGCQTFSNPVRVATPVDPDAVVAGDLNGDGRTDLIWLSVNSTITAGHVQLAQANGGYLPGPDFVLPGTTTGVPSCATADVTRDGKLDLICATPNYVSSSATVVVLPGKGDGSFGPPITTTFPNQLGSTVILTLAGDLNGDGVPDFIFNNILSSPVLVLLSDGQGGFLPTKSVRNPYSLSRPISIDINGDGILDILWPEGAAVALGKGDGSFEDLLTPSPVGSTLSSCAFHDMDGDGKLDAVCGYLADTGSAAGTAFDILHGNGDGTFNPVPIAHQEFGSSSIAGSGSGDFLEPVIISDVNKDGIPDVLAISGDGLAVLLGQPGLAFGAPSHYAPAFSKFPFASLASTQTVYTDLDGDGLVDVLAAGPNGMYLLFGHADGSFGSARATKVSEVNGHLAVADFNGDKKADVISSGAPGLSLSLGRGDGTFSSPVPIPGAPFATGAPLYAADFNGDGVPDLLSIDSSYNYHLMPGKGDGTFAPAIATTGLAPAPSTTSSTDTYTVPYSLTGDLNSDGKADLFTITFDSLLPNYSLVSALSMGDGSFSSIATTYPAPPFSSSGFYDTPLAPVLADFSHRGKLDAAYFLNESLYIVRGNGDGSFEATPTILATPTVAGLQADFFEALQVADFDGDGNLDIAFLSWFQPTFTYQGGPSCVFIYFGNGDGTFESPTQAGCFTHAYTDLRIADFNGDGRPDIVLQTASALNNYAVGVVDTLGSRNFGPEINFTAGSLSGDMFIADLNLDGRPDLVFGNQLEGSGLSANSVTVLINETSPVATGTLSSAPDPSYVGQPFVLSATLTPPVAGTVYTGSITFYVDGNTVGSAMLTRNAATIGGPTALAVGTHQVSATWPGDNNNSALNLSGTHTVAPWPVNVLVTSSTNPSTIGQNVTFTIAVAAAAVPGTPAPAAPFTGTLTLYDGVTLLAAQTSSSGTYSFNTSALAAGVHAISASYTGDANFASAMGTLSQTVNGLPLSMSLSANPDPALVGDTVTVKAQLASAGNCANCAYTKDVQFTDGGALLGSTAVDASGAATLAATFMTVGSHVLRASYPGDSSHQAASSTLTEVIMRAATSLKLTASASSVPAGTPVTFVAKIILTGPAKDFAGSLITFSDGASVFATVAADATGTASASISNLIVGSHTITAALAQNATLNASSASVLEVITRAVTAISLTASPNPAYQYQALTVQVALATPTGFPASGTVQLMDGGQGISTLGISSNAATFSTNALAVGIHTLTAVYAGDTNTLAATSSSLVVRVLASDFTLSSIPPAITVQSEHHLTFLISAESIGGFTDRLKLSTAILPNHMTIKFASPTVNLSTARAATVSVYLDTDDVIGYARAAPSGKPGTTRSSPRWAILPATLLLCFNRRRVARRSGVSLILLACLVLPLAGCSSLYPKSTAPGTYSIQIQAVGAATGLAHTLNLQVTVTP